MGHELIIEEIMGHEASIKPHVLIFPLPYQSTVNSMMKLAEILCLSGVNVTFLNTKYNQKRLISNTNVMSRIERYTTTGRFQFETISDGLPDDHPRLAEHIPQIFVSLQAVAEPFLREKLKSSIRGEIEQPVTCVIAEGYHYYAIDVALDVGLPVYAFETMSPCCLWTYVCLTDLVQAGELPFAEKDSEMLVRNIPGMETFFRLRDLPVFCRDNFMEAPDYMVALKDAYAVQRANGLILNTFHDLDDLVLSQLKTRTRNLYAIGPVHRHLQVRLAGLETQDCTSNNFWKEDGSCIKWLDGKAPKSVIFVSFGSLARVSKAELMEFWHGLVDSGAFFLWVIRLDSLFNEKLSDDSFLKQLEEGTDGRGHIVSWAPQEEILRHKSVGGFLTHSGWGSTMESIVEGVPMLCWPDAFDQHPTSRFVSEVWKLGFDMKDVNERSIITTMVKKIMDERKNKELREQAEKLKHLAQKSVSKGGSSYLDLDRFVKDITSFCKMK